ncbi:RNA-binding protein 42-like [Lolium rigidum]|uniref:RNA-binding protein 42-like n=1 Tax=Lolium rigidum TaxID=89674 RepID=UPI001F5DF8D8|nr:RNA-binding protein 42-like [Lolium rigidum]
MAAAAPARRLLLRLRLGNPPPLPVPLLSHIAPQLLPHQPPPPAPAAPLPGSPAPSPDPKLRDLLFAFHPAVHIYPSLVDPIGGDDVCEGGAEVWADSVKKKRKRKMNKHKLRKLRKRLRRQT